MMGKRKSSETGAFQGGPLKRAAVSFLTTARKAGLIVDFADGSRRAYVHRRAYQTQT
jgi:hypothetical protein